MEDLATQAWLERRPENLARYLGLRVSPPHQLIYDAMLNHRSLLVLAPRGLGKSFCDAVIATWLAISRPENRDPSFPDLFPGAPTPVTPSNVSVCIGAHKFEHAVEMLKLVRSFLQQLEPVYGQLEASGNRQQLTTTLRRRDFNVKEPTITALGRDSRWAGSHFHVHILDDLVSKEVGHSLTLQRKLASDFASDIMPTRRPWGRTLMSGTRWAVEDLYQKICERHRDGTWDEAVRLPALAEAYGEIHSIDPAVYSIEYLQGLRRDNPNAYQAQYQQRIDTAAGTSFFDEEWLSSENWAEFEDLPQHVREIATTTIALDPAAGDDPAKNDASAFVVVSVIRKGEKPLFFIRHVERGHWRQAQILDHARALLKQFRPRFFVVEAVGGFHLLAQELQSVVSEHNKTVHRLHHTRFQARNPTVERMPKQARAEHGRVLLDRDLVRIATPTDANGLDRLLWECRSYDPQRKRHEPGADDCVDALFWALLQQTRSTSRARRVPGIWRR